MLFESLLGQTFKSSLLDELVSGNILLPEVVLVNSFKLSMHDSQFSLLNWRSENDAFAITLDASETQLPIRINQITVRVEVLQIDFSNQQQSARLNITIVDATSDQLLGRIAIWIAQAIFSSIIQRMLDDGIPKALDGTDVKASRLETPGTFDVDLSKVPAVQGLVNLRPVPMIDKGPLDLLEVTGCGHSISGLNVNVSKSF